MCNYCIDLSHAITYWAKYPWNLQLQPYWLLTDWNGAQHSYAAPFTDNISRLAYGASNNAPFWTDMKNSRSRMKFLAHVLIARQPQRMVEETCGHGDSAFSRVIGFPRLEPMSTFLSSSSSHRVRNFRMSHKFYNMEFIENQWNAREVFQCGRYICLP